MELGKTRSFILIVALINRNTQGEKRKAQASEYFTYAVNIFLISMTNSKDHVRNAAYQMLLPKTTVWFE